MPPIRSITLPTETWNPARAPRDLIRYIDVSSVSRDSLSITNPAPMPTVEAPSRARKIVAAGDTIFATIRPRLKRVAQVPVELDGQIASTAFCVLRPDTSQIDPDFLFFLVSSDDFVSAVADLETGASYPAVRDRDILDQDVDLPPLDEQHRIAEVLRVVWNRVLAEDRLVTCAFEVQQSAMRRLLSRGSRSEPVVETEIGPVPSSWTVGSLGDFAEFQRGFDITKGEQAVDGDIPVVSSGGVKSFHDEALAAAPGVVVGRKGSIGTVHFVESDYWPHDTTLWCKDFHGNVPRFVFYRLQLLDMKRLDSGAANPALNRNYLHAEMVSWPDIPEQMEIVEILDAVGRKIDVHRRKREVLDALFKSLLHRLLIGDLTVDELDVTDSTLKGAVA